MSRGFLRDQKNSRTSGKLYGEGPLSGRTMHDGYCQEQMPRTNYNSREFTPGIFTNELNRKAEMGRKRQQPKQIPLELTEIVDYSNMKARSSKKQFDFPIQSREESIHSYHQQEYINMFDERKFREEMKLQMQQMTEQVEYHCIEKMKRMINDQSARIKQNFNDLIRQTNSGFMKRQETLQALRNQTFSIRQDLGQFKRTYQIFSQQSEEKIENLCMEMSNLGVKKSKINGDYNVDLKNSFQGMNSSLSINVGNESHGSKIVNEVICQLDAQKKQLSDTKQLIEQLNQKINLKLQTLTLPPENKDEKKEAQFNFNKDQVMKMIKEAFGEDVKRSRFLQKVEDLNVKIRDLETIMFKQEQNITGMNDQFANSVNNQINPKIKKIQAAITDLYAKSDISEFTKVIKHEVNEEFNQKLKDTKVLKIRSTNQQQAQKLSILTGANQDKISYKETYLLDQENYLLDSEGNYIVQECNKQKQRIKIDQKMIYLLQLKGIEIMTST